MEANMTVPTNKAVNQPNQSWGSEGARQKDILIPKLSLVQALSDVAKQGKAKEGDIVHSITGQVLANKTTSVEFIPITTYAEWLVNELDNHGRSTKMLAKFAVTPENEELPKEGVMNGKPVSRVYCLNFCVVLPKFINELPFILSFRKTSLYAGRKLSTHFQVSQMKGQPPAAYVFKLSSQDKTWQQNTFPIFTVEPSRVTTPDELAVAKQWYLTLSKKAVGVDEQHEAEEPVPF